MANGMPSRRRQISTTAPASSALATEKRGATALGTFNEQGDCGRVDSRADIQRGHRPQLLVGDARVLRGWSPES